MKNKVALVTGGNRGIGFEVCRQLGALGYTVLVGARDIELGKKAASELTAQGMTAQAAELDVSDQEQIDKLAASLHSRFGQLDVLVNNAAIFLDPMPAADGLGDRSVFKAKTSNIVKTFATNTLGPLQLCQAFVPAMIKNNYGRVVNVSSGDGQLSDMNGGRPAYRLSKVSLNALTRIFADELKGKNVLINSVCPGWVKTRMGGTAAKREVSKGAETIVWAATLPDDGPSGGFYRDFKPIAW